MMKFIPVVRNGKCPRISPDEIRIHDTVFYEGEPCQIESLDKTARRATLADGRECGLDDFDVMDNGYAPGLEFDNALTVHVPAEDMVTTLQTLRRGVLTEDWKTITGAIDSLESQLQAYTFQPQDQPPVSGSSVVLRDIAPGIVRLTDGTDLICKAGHLISNVLKENTCKDNCPHYTECFDAKTGMPHNGIIKPYGCDASSQHEDDYMDQLTEQYGLPIRKNPIQAFRITCLRHKKDGGLFACLHLFDRYILQMRVDSDNFYQLICRCNEKPRRPNVTLEVKEDPENGEPYNITVLPIQAQEICFLEDLESLYYEFQKAEEAQSIIQNCLIDHWRQVVMFLQSISDIG